MENRPPSKARPDEAPAPDAPASAPPAGRLRLAAGLAGAGVLAVGFGAGIVQSAAQEAPPAAPGENAVGGQDPTVAPPAQTVAESPSSTRTDTSTEPAPISSTGEQPAPAPEAAPPAEPAPPAPAPEASPPAAPPAPEQPAAPAPAAKQAKAIENGGEWGDKQAAEDCSVEEVGFEAAPETKATKEIAPEEQCADAETVDRNAPTVTADDDHGHADKKKKVDRTPTEPVLRTPTGVPTNSNPGLSVAIPGAALIGVPNFFIDKFRIPPFLLPIYQAAGTEYGVRWEVLAAINEIETDYGRNLNVSSAGALGWMQFMPATWKAYGVDANGDKKKDPYNPVDAIFAAARYLKAAGAQDDLRRAIFAYNHADWYVESVLMRARLVGGMPTDLVGSLTGLTQGRFPLAGRTRYADDLSEREAKKKIALGDNAAVPVEPEEDRRGILLFAKPGTAAIATHDGKVVARGSDRRLGRYVKVRDAYGNTYTYARLSELELSYPVPKHGAKTRDHEHGDATSDKRLVEPRAGTRPSVAGGKERLFAEPRREAAYGAGGRHQVGVPVPQGKEEYVKELLRLSPDQVKWKRLQPGASIVAGTVLGHVGDTASTRSPHMLFEVRPAGRGAPRIDPKPILDGWKLLESTAIYRAKAKNPFFGRDAKAPTIGQILLMSKESLIRRVLANPHIDIYECGRQDVRTGIVDRRVLALLEFLAANGLRPGVTSLQCGHSYLTASGNVSHHSTGTATDIATLNGVSILGHQGEGSITDIAIRRMLTLQGAMKPDQIISLMKYEGASNTYSMGDHADHIHVGYRPVGGDPKTGKFENAVLKPGQWRKLIDRLSAIENPVVLSKPSAASIKVTPKRHGNAGRRRRHND